MVTMKALKTLFIYLFTILAISSTAFAANISVTVSKNRLVKNEVLQLKVVVDEIVDSDAIDFTPLEQDFYLGRPNFGTSRNFINGARSSHSEWNLSLAPQRLGIITIPAFTIDGVSSTPITLQVSMDEEEPKTSDLLELQSSLNTTRLYPNESATLQTRLIIKTNPRQLQNPQITPPQADGLSIEPLGEPNQYQSVLDGVQVTVIDQNYRITAESKGAYSLSSIGFKGSAAYRSNTTGATKLVSLTTAPEQFAIEVKPIPADAVGTWLPTTNLKLKQRWLDGEGNPINASDFTLKLGDSLTREISLDIVGIPMERFPDITSNYPSSIRLYQEKPQFSQVENITTRMTIKQVLIAQQLGTITLDAIQLPWWNSQTEQQEVATIKGLILRVEQGELIQPEVLPTQAANTVQIQTVTDSGIWPYLTALFATLWVATVILWQRRREMGATFEQKVENNSTTKDQLLTALRSGDKVRSCYLATVWLKEIQTLKESDKQLIKNELLTMNTSEFGSSSSHWNSETLVKLVQKFSKSKAHHTKESEKLADL